MLVDTFIEDAIKAVCPPDQDYALALYTTLLDATTQHYSTTNEWKGHGYEYGGAILEGYRIENGSLYFNSVEWLNADISTRSGLIYNLTTGKAIKVLDFKRTIGVMGGLFEVKLKDTPVFDLGRAE